jgi:hypothetical protein
VKPYNVQGYSEAVLELISKSLDEPLNEEEQAQLDLAFSKDHKLIDLRETLKLNRAFCLKISSEPPVLSPLPFPVPARRLNHLYPVLSVAAMILLSTFILFFIRGNRNVEQPQALDAQLISTQKAFEDAIDTLEKRALVRLQELPPDVQKTFKDNLNVINQAIAQCERSFPDINAPYFAYKNLALAYNTKVRLLNQILET